MASGLYRAFLTDQGHYYVFTDTDMATKLRFAWPVAAADYADQTQADLQELNAEV